MAQKNFKSSDEIYSWLCGYINYERGLPPSRSFRLDRMEILAEMAGHPERCAPVVHIAGSKGKGSVAVMAASIMEAAGKKTARYMSPHVSDFRERISLGNAFFSEDIYCAAADELRHLAEHTLPSAKISLFDPASDEGEALTFFELMTMLFFLCARTKSCDGMVVETGMGGRLDCTNIVDPAVSVITLIELEHTAVLGKTIAEIAGEKAGIIKQGKPLVLARQNTEALEKISGIAAEKGSTLFYFPEFALVENVNVHKNGTDFSMMLDLPNAFSWKPVASAFSIPVPGAVQAENAALAAAALSLAFPGIDREAIKRGLKQAGIPGRFEKIANNDGGCDI
ncbi:MAG: Mur ligase family protein, partial [Treponema sp.]|nr:Mur ligase family protein [Treponema sp.]